MEREVTEFDTLMAWVKAARIVIHPFLAEEGNVTPTLEEFAEVTRALVWDVQRLRQLMAIKAEEERIAEQIRLGYR